MIRADLKDWEVAREMFGKNTKVECKIVSRLRKNIIVEPLCDGWSTIRKTEEEIGWIISDKLIDLGAIKET